MKIINVVGARPNFVKIKPLMEAMKKHTVIKPLLVHTGQHYDYNMSDSFFKELCIPKPDINLGVKPSSHAKQTAQILEKFETLLLKKKPDLVVVLGDVTSTLACALAASKLHIKVAHVEAGMRSFDRRMPEEINRILTDQLSDYLFTAQQSDNVQLLKEGIDKKKIFLVGNIMADTLISTTKLKAFKETNISNIIPSNPFAVLTIHRQENVDSKENLETILKSIQTISSFIPVVFPAHPRTRKLIEKNKFWKYLKSNVHILEPLGYFEFLKLYSQSKLVLTDSGGLQAETSLMGVPCLTMRKSTEWTVTLEKGTNTLVGLNSKKIISTAKKILNNSQYRKAKIPKWDGKTAERIVKHIIAAK